MPRSDCLWAGPVPSPPPGRNDSVPIDSKTNNPLHHRSEPWLFAPLFSPPFGVSVSAFSSSVLRRKTRRAPSRALPVHNAAPSPGGEGWDEGELPLSTANINKNVEENSSQLHRSGRGRRLG